MKQKFYWVVSVRELKGLLRTAERSEEIYGNGDNHCIVLHGITSATNHDDQLSTSSVEFARLALEQELENARRASAIQPQGVESSRPVSTEDLNLFLESLRSAHRQHDAESGSVLDSVLEFETPRPGQKYVRFTKRLGTSNRSAYCFVDLRNGDILKPDGWKRPAKHARGNIRIGNAANWFNGALGPYGAAYLR